MKNIFKKPQVLFGLLGFLVFAALVTFSYRRTFDAYELQLLDMRYKLRPAVKTDPSIVFIEISDDSIDKIGSWPFDRQYHALLTTALKSAGARAIIFDVFFSEERDGDADLTQAVKDAGNVYLPYVFRVKCAREMAFPEAEEYDAPLIDSLSGAARGTGHINILPDIDGKFRRVPPYMQYEGRAYAQMSFRAILDVLGLKVTGVEPGRQVTLSDGTVMPLDLYSNVLVNFPDRWAQSFRHYSYIDVLSSYLAELEGGKGSLDLSAFKGAICLVGITATAAPDAHPSPFEPLYPGVGIHASLINSVIKKDFLFRASKGMNIAVLLFVLFLTYLDSRVARKRMSIIYIIGIILSFLCTAYALFAVYGVWIDVFYPVIAVSFLYLGLTFKKYMTEMRKREMIEKELLIAKTIQESFLPRIKPDAEGINIQEKMATAKQIGGDLYDFVNISAKRTGVLIGDVSGKGVPAALYMARVVSEFRQYAKDGSPSASLCKLNNQLSEGSTTSLFVTAAYFIFDTEKMSLSFSMGGHLPVVMMREGETEPRLLDSTEGMPLGIMECSFNDTVTGINAGDLFVFYTDGVTEAMNPKQEMFGQERLVKLVKDNFAKTTHHIVEIIHQEVAKFEGKAEQHDDITVIAVKVLKTS